MNHEQRIATGQLKNYVANDPQYILQAPDSPMVTNALSRAIPIDQIDQMNPKMQSWARAALAMEATGELEGITRESTTKPDGVQYVDMNAVLRASRSGTHTDKIYGLFQRDQKGEPLIEAQHALSTNAKEAVREIGASLLNSGASAPTKTSEAKIQEVGEKKGRQLGD